MTFNANIQPMVLALAITSNILWFAFTVWREISAKNERAELHQEVLDISLDCMSRLQARGPGDYKLLSEVKRKFPEKLEAPIVTDDFKAKILQKTKDSIKSEMDKALGAESYRGQAINSGRGCV